MKAYLQFGGVAVGMPSGPFETVEVPVRVTGEPRWGQTRSGYGPALPTCYMVRWAGRWRRVKMAQYGNAGSAYIGRPGAWEATVEVDRGA